MEALAKALEVNLKVDYKQYREMKLCRRARMRDDTLWNDKNSLGAIPARRFTFSRLNPEERAKAGKHNAA